MIKYTQFRFAIPCIIGNILEHYDNALFGLLIPFIAPLFFNETDYLTNLIYAYALLPAGRIARPIGALFFGWLGDFWGNRNTLAISLIGMALVTVGIGCLPTFDRLGFIAPLLLCIGRIMQNFFAAGETTGGAIYLLENSDKKQKNILSALYDSSSIAGIILASTLVTCVCYFGDIKKSWRVLFFLGGFTGIIGFYLRIKENNIDLTFKRVQKNILTTIWNYRKSFISIAIVSGFSHSLYAMAFTLMNGYAPIVSTVSQFQANLINTILLWLDMLLLPLFGYLANKIGREKQMFLSSCTAALLAIPLFTILSDATFEKVVFVRAIMMCLGIAFAACYYAWSTDLVSEQHRFLIMASGSAFGSLLIGTPTSFISLWLYQNTGWPAAPSLYLIVTAFLASLTLLPSLRKVYLQNNSIA